MNCLDLRTSVIDSDLCCGCGACVGVCPAGALEIDIRLSHKPAIVESKCTDCGLCVEVCPGKGYAVARPSKDGCSEGATFIPGRGPVIECLAGYSNDPDIRSGSSSGGIATALLIHLLETGQVDSVLVVGMKDERPVASLTDDIEEVKKAAGSKYGPVPVLAVLIPELMRKPRRIAGTFTPCQLGGWHEATKHIPRLKESGVISVGLFCGYVQSYDALSSAAASIGLEYPGGARLTHWRYGSYPGGLRFERPDGSEALKPLYSYYDLVIPHFSLYRCFLCPDSGNWLSDITLGDIHTEGERENVIVCRTARGRDLLESARNAGRITTRLMTPGQIENSTLRNIERSKMLPALECIDWLRKNGMMIPAGFDYFDLPPRKISGMLRSVWLWKLRMIFWFRRGRQRRFLLKHPSIMEWTGHFLYNLPGSIPGWKLMIRVRSLFRS